MLKPASPHCVDLNATLALRLLRACPHAVANMNLSAQQMEQLKEFKALLARTSRRPLKLAAQNTPALSCDERCLLNALAYAQQGMIAPFDKLVLWLFPNWAAAMVAKQFKQMADMFVHMNISLLPDHAKPPLRREEPAFYAVIGSVARNAL